ncbi:MAG TPA: methionine adenosyltransferase [Spirochaetia bacterium]|nr:methionine adenosyltransferase [Spirochaetia bacterium]
MARQFLTSESVTEGHPDKVADRVSDSILDAILAKDRMARVACETVVTTGLVLVAGEITTDCYVDIPRVVRDTILNIGYTRAKYGFDGDTCAVIVSIDEQSPDIAMGVNQALESRESANQDHYDSVGAGDQGMMFGYATDETPEMMPLPIALAHRITKRMAETRRSGEVAYLRPDGKSQVTIEYADGKPCRLDTVVLSTQHDPKVDMETIRRDMIEQIIRPLVPPGMEDRNTRFLINPTGRFVVGGPQGDCGLTGRKIIVDTYGGLARHGGGSFSGKDPTKVDRSAAYAARHVAKNIVAAGLSPRCEVQLAYAIGVARPVSIMVDTFGQGRVDEELLVSLVHHYFDLRPAAIIDRFDLRRPIYQQLSAYGHFGRTDLDLPWERTELAEVLRGAAGIS